MELEKVKYLGQFTSGNPDPKACIHYAVSGHLKTHRALLAYTSSGHPTPPCSSDTKVSIQNSQDAQQPPVSRPDHSLCRNKRGIPVLDEELVDPTQTESPPE